MDARYNPRSCENCLNAKPLSPGYIFCELFEAVSENNETCEEGIPRVDYEIKAINNLYIGVTNE